jgi:hypothetical protein
MTEHDWADQAEALSKLMPNNRKESEREIEDEYRNTLMVWADWCDDEGLLNSDLDYGFGLRKLAHGTSERVLILRPYWRGTWRIVPADLRYQWNGSGVGSSGHRSDLPKNLCVGDGLFDTFLEAIRAAAKEFCKNKESR